jgi:hypothetical protein
VERLTANDLRALLEAALDASMPEVDRRNAISILRVHLSDALEATERGGMPTETP